MSSGSISEGTATFTWGIACYWAGLVLVSYAAFSYAFYWGYTFT